ncbi:MAG: GTP cyclohydrolase II [Candidatus Contendobacter sp.]|nr:GTP cyclohydrolase II [Candidatus Contendobacter sp.]
MSEPTVKSERSPINTPYGAFEMIAYEFPSGREHIVLVCGNLADEPCPLVRVQSACLPGTVFKSRLCDCAEQTELAMKEIANAGVGCLLYLDQEGRGHGLVEKIAHIRGIVCDSLDTVDSARRRGVEPDVRSYEEAAWIIRELIGKQPIRLLTNNPIKMAGLQTAGISVEERLSIEAEPNQYTRTYLITKKEKMGHLLSKI